MLNRCRFLREALAAGAGIGLACTLGVETLSGCAATEEPILTTTLPRGRPALTLPSRSQEARFYRRLGGGAVQCGVCFLFTHKLQRLPLTPVETLEAAVEAADAEGLQYVYIGNCPGHECDSTFCPECGHKVMERVHFAVIDLKLDRGQCPSCDHKIPGIWRDV